MLMLNESGNPAMHGILEANRACAESFGDKAKLVGAPRRRFAILTCMDARMDPAKLIGLSEGDAHVIRNAGGRASDDAIRSLVVSCKLVGTTDWLVIHHSGCGMESYTDDDIRHLLGLDGVVHDKGSKWHDVQKSAHTPADIHWLTFKDLTKSRMLTVSAIIPSCQPQSRYTASFVTFITAASNRWRRRTGLARRALSPCTLTRRSRKCGRQAAVGRRRRR